MWSTIYIAIGLSETVRYILQVLHYGAKVCLQNQIVYVSPDKKFKSNTQSLYISIAQNQKLELRYAQTDMPYIFFEFNSFLLVLTKSKLLQ